MHEVRRNAETWVGVIVNPCENGRIAGPSSAGDCQRPAIVFLWLILHFRDTYVKITFVKRKLRINHLTFIADKQDIIYLSYLEKFLTRQNTYQICNITRDVLNIDFFFYRLRF